MSLGRDDRRCRGDGADDQGVEPPLSAAVRRARRADHDERDDRRPAPAAEAAGRVRADSPRARRAVLRRSAGRHQPRGDGVGGGTGRVARRRPRRRQLRLPDRPFHAQGPGRVDRPAAATDSSHRRGDEARRAARAGDREDPPRLERRRPQLPGPGQGGGRRRRRRHHGARAHAQCPLPDGRRLGRHRRGGRRRPGARRRQRRPAVPARDQRRPRPLGLRRGDVGPGRAHQAVAVSRGDGRLRGPGRRGAPGHLSPLRHAGPRALGRRRPRPVPGPRVPALARRILVPLRPTARRRVVAVDAAARRGAGAAYAARAAVGAVRRRRARLRVRSPAVRNRDRSRRGARCQLATPGAGDGVEG